MLMDVLQNSSPGGATWFLKVWYELNAEYMCISNNKDL